jgi:hypothetical protein
MQLPTENCLTLVPQLQNHISNADTCFDANVTTPFNLAALVEAGLPHREVLLWET